MSGNHASNPQEHLPAAGLAEIVDNPAVSFANELDNRPEAQLLKQAREITRPFEEQAEWIREITEPARKFQEQLQEIGRPLERQSEELRRVTEPARRLGEQLREIMQPTDEVLGALPDFRPAYDTAMPEIRKHDSLVALDPAEFRSPVAETNKYLAEQNEHLREQAAQAQAAQKRQLRLMYVMVALSAVSALAAVFG